MSGQWVLFVPMSHFLSSLGMSVWLQWVVLYLLPEPLPRVPRWLCFPTPGLSPKPGRRSLSPGASPACVLVGYHCITNQPQMQRFKTTPILYLLMTLPFGERPVSSCGLSWGWNVPMAPRLGRSPPGPGSPGTWISYLAAGFPEI